MAANLNIAPVNLAPPANNPTPPPVSLGGVLDSDEVKIVYLVVRLPPHPPPYLPQTESDAASLHWSIRWSLGNNPRYMRSCERVIGVEHHPGRQIVDRSVRPKTPDELWIPIATLTLGQRRVLEALAMKQGVQGPEREWSCQRWLSQVLLRAAKLDDPIMKDYGSPLLTDEEAGVALFRARTLT